MGILCKLLGHKIITPSKQDSVDSYTGEKGFTKYCDRCSHTEFVGTGLYDNVRLVEIIRSRLSQVYCLIDKEKNFPFSDMVREEIGIIQKELGKLYYGRKS